MHKSSKNRIKRVKNIPECVSASLRLSLAITLLRGSLISNGTLSEGANTLQLILLPSLSDLLFTPWLSQGMLKIPLLWAPRTHMTILWVFIYGRSLLEGRMSWLVKSNNSNIGTRDVIFSSITGAASDAAISAWSCWIFNCKPDKSEGRASANLCCTLSSKASMSASMIGNTIMNGRNSECLTPTL